MNTHQASLFCYVGLLHEQNMAKMRLLTFMGMAVENKEISFDTMQQELQIGADDVEAFVIDGKTEHFHLFLEFLIYMDHSKTFIWKLNLTQQKFVCSRCVFSRLVDVFVVG